MAGRSGLCSARSLSIEYPNCIMSIDNAHEVRINPGFSIDYSGRGYIRMSQGIGKESANKMNNDEYFMKAAIELSAAAVEHGNEPFGAVLVKDGENWESDDHVENKFEVSQLASFEGWNVWKDEHRKGLDCVVKINRDGNVITMQTENLGIAIRSVTTVLDDVQDVYVALTGDQCALTNIRVSRV